MHNDALEAELMMNGLAVDLGVLTAQTGLAQQVAAQAPTGIVTLPTLSVTAGQQTPSGWPAAVTVRPDNWNMDLQPATYTIAAGDTLSGLAATYLGSPARVMEIWNLQPQQFRFTHSMDEIFPGDVFLMPDEARDNLKAWLALGQPTDKKPGALSKADKSKAGISKYVKYWPYAAGAAVGLGILYAMSR
jgi:hypothetical protein